MFGSAKTMTVRVKNPLGASVGDTVWVESADGTVLGYAALVFLIPIVVCAVLYAAASALFTPIWVSCLAAAVGFVGSFALLGILERKKKRDEPDIVITDIAADETEE